jgi:hypothetical protein
VTNDLISILNARKDKECKENLKVMFPHGWENFACDFPLNLRCRRKPLRRSDATRKTAMATTAAVSLPEVECPLVESRSKQKTVV